MAPAARAASKAAILIALVLVAGVIWSQWRAAVEPPFARAGTLEPAASAQEPEGALEGAARHVASERQTAPSPIAGDPPSAFPEESDSSHVFAGLVVSVAGDAVAGCTLQIRPRGYIPGEDYDVLPLATAVSGPDGSFSIALPASWRGPTVYCRALLSERTVGMGNYSVAREQTILVDTPSAPQGFEFRVFFDDCGVEQAALLLTNPGRDISFGEATWAPGQEQAHVRLAVPRDRVLGPVLVMLGELGEGNRISFLARREYPDIESCIAAGASGLRVPCAKTQVAVPPFQMAAVRRVKIWSLGSLAVAAHWLDVENEHVRCRLAAGMEHGAQGELEDGRTVVGYLSPEPPWSVVWQAAIDETQKLRIDVETQDGQPVTDAMASIVLLGNHEGASGGAFVRFGRSDTAGGIDFVGLCPGTYHAVVERMMFGDSRRQVLRFDVPGPDVRCVISMSGVVRLEPDFGATPMSASLARAWMRPSGGAWREVTDPRWQFSTLGLIEGLEAADYDFLFRLPPFIGIAGAHVSATDAVQDVVVRMAWETTAAGQVVDAAGLPVAGRWVSAVASGSGAGPDGPEWSQQQTGPDGRFEICLIPDGNTVLHVWNVVGSRVQTVVDAAANVRVVLPASAK